MKKLISLLMALAMLLGVISLAACSSSKQVLTIYTWEDMFPQEVLDGFTEKTGIEINYANFDLDETMLAKLEAAEGGDYDLVIADDYIIEQAIQEGLVQKLSKDKLTNLGNVNPVFTGEFYDPTDEYTVPYGAGIIEIAYYPDKIGFEIDGYEDLWDERLEGKVGVLGNYRVVNGMALTRLGYSMNTENLDEIQEAGDLLNELAPNIRLISDSYLNENLIAGEVDAILTYTANATVAALTDPNVKIVLPKEGFGYGIMGMFIPSKAPNSDAAHQFIDYILDAEVGALCFEYMGYYSTNSAADELISDEIKEYVTLPEDITDNREMIQNISTDANDMHEQVWNEFKKQCN